jgi:hypothetical protein
MANPLSVTVGALASADADGICVSQTCPGAFDLAINGALASGYSATNVAAAQAVAGAGDLTLNGTLVSGGVAYLGGQRRVYITSAGNDTGITFTVKGTLSGEGNSGISYQSETITGSNTSVVATTKLFTTITAITASNAAAGNVSVGVQGSATLDKARRVLITSAGNDSGMTFTVYGTDWNSNPISQTVTGGNATTAVTTLDFLTVTRIKCSAATAGAVTVGTNGVAGSRPLFFDWAGAADVSLQVSVSGTVNYTVKQTVEDIAALGIASVSWVDHPDTDLVGATTVQQGNYGYVPRAMQIVLNSGSGSVTLHAMQAS